MPMTQPNPECPKCKGTGAYLESDPRPEVDDPMPYRCELCFPEEGPTPEEAIGDEEAEAEQEQRHEHPVLGCDCFDCMR
jgi:hypothetical protein